MTNNKIHKLLIITAVLIMVLIPSSSFADSGYLSVSDSSAYVGNYVSVTLSFSGSYQGLEGALSYDPSVLQYSSASGSGSPAVNGGGGELRYATFQQPGNMYITFSFKVVGVGTSSLTASSSVVMDAEGNVSAGSTSAYIEGVNYTPSPGGSSNQNNSSDDDDDEPEQSSVSTLSSITPSAGELTPAFSPDVYAYTIYVGKDETSCVISATPTDDKARVDISGESELADYSTKRTITVTAENGTQSTYDITIIRDKKPDDGNTIKIDEIEYLPVEKLNLSALPKGFEAAKAKYNKTEINVAKSADGKYTLAELQLKGTPNTAWFLFDEKSGKFTPVEIVKIEGKNYIKIASGLERLYGDADGKGEYFIYDPATKELLGLSGDEKPEAVKKDTKASQPDYTKWFSGAACVLLLITIILQIILLASRKKKKKNFSDDTNGNMFN